ncbi:MAG: hypothetical protein NC218_02045 [Acetobacter sp.]|nr:hypothetical protein [Acetobacter sp.]
MSSYAITCYTDVLLAVTRKQEAMARILKVLIEDEGSRAGTIKGFLGVNKERICSLQHELATDSDVEDFNNLFAEDEVSLARLTAAQTAVIMHKATFTDEEEKQYRANLFDILNTEFIEAVNEEWKNAHKDV